MYKVLLVDDEKIILEGIAKLVQWEQLNMTLIGTAQNGKEAFEIIERNRPDVIISDIRMPGMDGLQLVQKTTEHYPDIRFILLSGYDNFEYARNAMQWGVRHYLLKPCNEKQIMEALEENIAEIEEDQSRKMFEKTMEHGLSKVMPYAKEQFLKEFVTNKMYDKADWEYYQQLFNLDHDISQIRLILFNLPESVESEHIFALRNIAEDILKPAYFALSATLGERVLLLVEDVAEQELHETIEHIKQTYNHFYKIRPIIAISDSGKISEARELYRDTLGYLKHGVIANSEGLLTSNSYSKITAKVLETIERYSDHPDLSLNWIASNVLYMNADYLGKLFAKEVGERFSNYVVKVRIDKAKELIKHMDDTMIFEIAEQLGFGNNPKYFSQVFKKHTGYSPSDYKKKYSMG